MRDISRRQYLATAGAVLTGTLSGCSFGDTSPPPGSLRFRNNHTLPHTLTLRVTDVGSQPSSYDSSVEGQVIVPPAQRALSAATSLQPGEQHTYPGVFTEPVWYAVDFSMDDRSVAGSSGETVFNPAPDSRTDAKRYLIGEISTAGEFSWRIHHLD